MPTAIIGDIGTSSAVFLVYPGNAMMLRQFTAVSSGILQSMAAYMSYSATGASQKLRLCIYDDNGSNYPGNLIDVTAEINVNTSAKSWPSNTQLGGIIITGQKYWVGYWLGPFISNYADLCHSGSTGGVGYSIISGVTYSSTGNPVSTFPSGATSRAGKVEVNATYTLAQFLSAIGLASDAAIGSTKETRGLHASGIASLSTIGTATELRGLHASGLATTSAIGTAVESRRIHAVGIASSAIVGLAHLLGGSTTARNKYQTILYRRQLTQIKGINW